MLRLDAQDRRIALATGIGAGIGAIFRAPLGGAILAAEILYKEDLKADAIIPALIASIVGYSIFGSWSGRESHFFSPSETDIYAAAPTSLLRYFGHSLWMHRVALRTWLLWHHPCFPEATPSPLDQASHWRLTCRSDRLFIPQALGMGYGWVQISMGSGYSLCPCG